MSNERSIKGISNFITPFVGKSNNGRKYFASYKRFAFCSVAMKSSGLFTFLLISIIDFSLRLLMVI